MLLLSIRGLPSETMTATELFRLGQSTMLTFTEFEKSKVGKLLIKANSVCE